MKSLFAATILWGSLFLAAAGGGCSSTTDSAVSSCTDGVQNGGETDVDCGGGTCGTCAEDQACATATDCFTGACTAGKCADPVAPSCEDATKNGDESDVDCGGAGCNRCATGKSCNAASDCGSDVCTAGKCVASAKPTCTDGMKNGDETDVDCGGGTCIACGYNKACTGASDCLDGVCNATSSACDAPTCDDGIKNSNETDVDCGGQDCTRCGADKKCNSEDDCLSGVCSDTTGKCM